MRRRGKFYLSCHLIEKRQDAVRELFKHLEFIPVRVECLYDRDEFEYIGISPLFDQISDRMMTPEYIVTYKDGEVVVYKQP